MELTSPIGRPTLIGAPLIAGGAAEAAEAAEAGDGRRRTEDKEESFQGNKVPHSPRTLPTYSFFVLWCLFCVCHLFFLFSLCKKKSIIIVFFFFFFFFRLPFSSSACLVVRSTRLREKTEQHATKGVVFLFF